MKKIKLSSEAAYVLGILLLSLSVAMIASADFGVSMIVAPAYILSLKVSFLTFGQAEYIVQGILFIILCIAMKGVRLIYFEAFVTGLIYGAALDLWRVIIPHFNPDLYAPGSFSMPLRIVYFSVGMVMTSFSIALLFNTYFFPQVYDFFVKAVSHKYQLNRTKFKIGFDMTFLLISVTFSLILFGRFNGIGIGTVIMTCLNGLIIGAFSKLFEKHFAFEPRFKRLASRFEL